MNSKGFTLIELLAVITIMGILLLVAIPAISRTIENSRRDAFVDVTKTYINTVRSAVLANELKCGTDNIDVAAVEDDTYYFVIDSTLQDTKDLMESGGLSPWSNAPVKGYVKWVKSGTSSTYYAILADSGRHGLNAEIEEKSLNRSAIITRTGKYTNTIYKHPTTGTACTLK